MRVRRGPTSQDRYLRRSQVLAVAALLNSTAMIRVWPVGALWTTLPLGVLMVITAIQSYCAYRRTVKRIEREWLESEVRLLRTLCQSFSELRRDD